MIRGSSAILSAVCRRRTRGPGVVIWRNSPSGPVEVWVPEPVGAENSVMSCDLQILVYQATEPVS